MTEHPPIQRWQKIFTRYPASEIVPSENREYVTYAYHLAALRACEDRVLNAAREVVEENRLGYWHVAGAHSACCSGGDPMTEHLPECCVGTDDCKAEPCQRCHACCICEQLRACEQRVAEETEAAMIESFYWKPSPPHDRHYFADNICAYCVGYREAFTAARKAVAGLPEYAMRDTCVSAMTHYERKRNEVEV